ISRLRRRRGERVVDERLALVPLIIWIETLLVTDCAIEPFADVRAARRTAPVRRINDHAVGQFRVETPECVVKLRRQFVRIAAQKIGPARRADEKRIAGENSPWRLGMIFLGRNVTDVLRSVTRSMTSRQDQRSKL